MMFIPFLFMKISNQTTGPITNHDKRILGSKRIRVGLKRSRKAGQSLERKRGLHARGGVRFSNAKIFALLLLLFLLLLERINSLQFRG